MNFKTIKTAVAKQFATMAQGELFRTSVSKDDLWNTYLSSFPEGTNPLYKERTEHDCNCCKQFVRAVGDVVAIVDGKMVSIWDCTVVDPNYQVVVNAMAKLVKSHQIQDSFLHYESSAGTNKSFVSMIDGKVGEWDHFHVNIPTKFVKPNKDIASALSIIRSTHDVFLRALQEIDQQSIDTVLELISQNSIYRGEEHKFVVDSFGKLKKKVKKLSTEELDMFVWENLKATPGSVTGIRNTVIGSLLTDLAEGKDLESAVKSFEAKVAPTNYKRPTALVTKKMIEDARATIESLGLTSALQRRYASIDDISINNILFANRDARQKINGDVFDDIAVVVANKPKTLDKVEEIGIEKFIQDILPKVTSIEVMMENNHTSNLVSLIAPTDPTANPLFKWDNGFSWSYTGDVTDSIKERVKAAGGNVTGDLCCRLAWEYRDDLDFHMHEPDGGHIYFANRRYKSSCGGMLDVDANGADGVREDPVENIVYESFNRMKEGVYTLKVNNYSRRDTKGVGFEVEIEFNGTKHSFVYDNVIGDGKTVEVAQIKYSKAKGIEIVKSLPSTTSSKKIWNVSTHTFHKVNVIMNSPNHWDGMNAGNKHHFFMLDGCMNEGKARGFYNEFLREDLNKHRKVIEIVGSKMLTEETENQLSGLGFSSTQRNSIMCKVSGAFSRVIKIVF